MYSESDIESAVAAGALSPESAEGLRAHVAGSRTTPITDEERFRLFTGFNEVFVSVALTLSLVTVAQIGASVGGWLGVWATDGHALRRVTLGGVTLASSAWMFAEYFTARRRMALPSILLTLAFLAGVIVSMIGALSEISQYLDVRSRSHEAGPYQINITPRLARIDVDALLVGLLLIATTSAASWLHWRRFAVPITIAAAAVAIVSMAGMTIIASAPISWRPQASSLHLLAGLLVFALAMRWDLSDRERRTRRADVAFWLHFAAAPLVAHPVFQMLARRGGDDAMSDVCIGVGLYIFFGLVAIAVDRRALLVSGLAYFSWTLLALFMNDLEVGLYMALSGLVIGAALLALSVFWRPVRAAVVAALGPLGRRLPPIA